jgi:hypothetical protein
MTISIRFTYDTVTPESVEQGDFNSAGFCDVYGNAISENSETDPATIPDEDIEQWKEPGDLYYCIDKACDLGITENVGNWFTSSSSVSNYQTGEEITYNLHIDGLTADQYSRVSAMLSKGSLDEYDESYLNSIDCQLSIV